MKTSELIRLLQEEDPTGECEVSVGNTDIYFVSHEPAYHDGCQQVLIHDDNLRPYYSIVGARYRSRGYKVVINAMSINDCLLDDVDFEIDYSDLTESEAKRYREKNEERRQSVIDMKSDIALDTFVRYSKKRAKDIADGADSEEIEKSAKTHYAKLGFCYDDQNHIPAKYNQRVKWVDPLNPEKEYMSEPSIVDRLALWWDDTLHFYFVDDCLHIERREDG